jgi:hypothetical protein
MELSVKDLMKDNQEKKRQKHQLYKELLTDVNDKIVKRNKTNYKNMIYTFPIIRMGYPLYNIERAMQYVIMKLNKGGFVAYPYGTSNTLYVDWSIVLKEDKKAKVIKKKKKVEFKKIELSDNILEKRTKQINKKSIKY